MKSKPRTTLVLIVLAGLSAGCAQPPAPVQGPRPVVVETPQPLDGPAGAEAYPGSVHARLEADLSFRVPGKIAQRKVEMGARVTPGMVLAVLDPQDAKLTLDNARAAVAAAEADLWLAQEEEKRYRDLKERGHVGQSVVDTRASTTKLAQARLDQARSQFDLAQNQSRYTRLTADTAGVVTQIWAEPGNVVTAGQPVVRFAADGEREVRINVSENRVDALRTAPQLAVEIFNTPGKRYAAKVRDINAQADAGTRTYEARVTILGPDEHVQLGATATVVVLAASDGKTFVLPATALGAVNDNQAAVWALAPAADGSSTVQPRKVQVLQYLDSKVVVTGELTAADRLVTAGVHRLIAGMAVQPIERAAKAAL
ncbi:MAG: efflux RND transporter periplasmic adaptor subunit [Panacagrimonas sp.]